MKDIYDETLDANFQQENDGNSANPNDTYLPGNTNYYLFQAAKYGFWLFWTAIAATAIVLLSRAWEYSIYANTYSIADDYYSGPFQQAVLELLGLTLPLYFLFQFSKKTKKGIEFNDAAMIDAGMKSLYQWILCNVLVGALAIFLRNSFKLIGTFLSIQGNLGLSVLALLAIFMAFQFWQSQTQKHEEQV